MKNLVIVESPAKAKTISKFLGPDYTVLASMGHVRDLPKSKLGFDPADNFKPQYLVSTDKKKVISELKKHITKDTVIYLAADEDREGEAIAWHLIPALKIEKNPIKRIVFHEITKDAILEALENPREVDQNLVDAQQARRILDRAVGYELSPLIWRKVRYGLSAGRVQSVAVRIIVDREKEIEAFIPEEYWKIKTEFKDPTLFAELAKINGKVTKVTNGSDAKDIEGSLNKGNFLLEDIEEKESKRNPAPPFTTSTLQQEASRKIGFSVKQTMVVAQQLYEGNIQNIPNHTGGLITYMRTDSLNLAGEAVSAVRGIIENRFGKKYLPEEPKVYNKKSKGAQEAHEAIRPTMLHFTPEMAQSFLKADEIKLYRLIYERFMACQMEDAQFEQQSIIFKGNENEFRASGRKLTFDGFYALTGAEDKDKLLPTLKEGEKAQLQSVKPEQHFTEPPARYSEASLIKKLESEGVGRPSTYAPTVATLSSRTYVTIEKKQIIPTEMAFTVTEILEKNFANIVDISFTANMEEKLDEVSEGTVDWQKLLSDFYFPFMEQVDAGKENIVSLKLAKPTGRTCPKCGESELLLRSGKFGNFIACSGFPKCKYTEQVDEEGNSAPKAENLSEEKCDKCGKDMLIKNGRNGQFLACSDYPDCKNTKSINVEEKVSETPCPDCGGKISLKNSRRGPFWGCEGYPECKFISKFEPTTIKCKEKGCTNGLLAERIYRNKNVYECVKCKVRTPREE